jgi:DNA-binding NtrC family response regulator
VRELHNVLERAVLLADGDRIDAAQLGQLVAPPLAASASPARADVTPLADAVAQAERTAIEQALAACGGNKTRAADRLGISVRTLWYKLRRLGLSTDDRHAD